MSNSDRIFTQNALLAFRRIQEDYAEEGIEYGFSDLARDMIPHMFGEKDLEDPEFDRRNATDTISLQVRRYLGLKDPQKPKGWKPGDPAPEKPIWREDYADAFSIAVRRTRAELSAADIDNAKVVPADYAALISKVIGRRLSGDQIRSMCKRIEKALDRPGMFEILSKVSDSVLKAHGPDDAAAVAHTILKSAHNWPAQSSKDRPKKSRRRA